MNGIALFIIPFDEDWLIQFLMHFMLCDDLVYLSFLFEEKHKSTSSHWLDLDH